MVITSPFELMVTVGFAKQPSFLLAFPIPENHTNGQIAQSIVGSNDSRYLNNSLLRRRSLEVFFPIYFVSLLW